MKHIICRIFFQPAQPHFQPIFTGGLEQNPLDLDGPFSNAFSSLLVEDGTSFIHSDY